ncbi:uncharacterized protein LOC105426156 isoform X3 [Pogonomyrmex barbatus]|uniref:Uncharacterized protein LOC105426156 isoform X3 n=1 Tax=Pogonomyrmex barbatus TaxID=144034 RepID=A0A6I9W1N2_9HYME|nr:uncharacterized protein LOC105426156 isoform X3 [Pogonomyrmex barbatus]
METRYDAMRCDATRRDATRCDAMRLVLDSQHSQRACCLLHDSGAGVPVCHGQFCTRQFCTVYTLYLITKSVEPTILIMESTLL